MATPVLLLHGLGSSFNHGWRRHGWIDLIEEAGRTVIPFDLPGHGSRAENTNPDEYRDVGGSLLSELAETRPIDLVGFSAGARVALRMASLAPDRFRRMVLIAAGDSFLTPYDPAPLIAAMTSERPEPGDRLAVFHRLARTGVNRAENLVAYLSGRSEVLDVQTLEKVTVPTLIITGSLDHMGSASGLRAAMPDVRHVEIAGCDHYALPSDPRTIHATLDFIAS